MSITRRTFVVAGVLAVPGVAAVSFKDEMVHGDTAIRLMESTPGANFTGFLVGVRTKIECTDILVTVFYRSTVLIQQSPTELLLSQESIAPCAGWDAYGATRRDFTMPKDSVAFIRLKFLEEVGEQAEFGREGN